MHSRALSLWAALIVEREPDPIWIAGFYERKVNFARASCPAKRNVVNRDVLQPREMA